ncbi:phage holin family protein [Haploplasma axanthum]|jgi:toxin secretion/phage lysis holin|uniref:Phage-related holin (Lysis protein) n=1 Tax=Haploplasma axanthum TaxID=29552 RepID=A0A449BET4_HAPAX|nr:phage holin family protein [Haploplasma axanthum]VEU80932.1 Phage-related holin (Lysis protein) [Haploplasma axanthum]
MKVKHTVLTIIGSIGSFASYLFGGFDKLLIALIIFMIIDFLSGLILAIVFKNSSKTKNGRVSSEAGIRGLAKKIFILFLVTVATQLDLVLGTSIVRDGVVIAFISMEGISILENATLAGLPVPRIIKNALEVLNKSEDENDE